MVSIIINTINENPDVLRKAVNSYLRQGDCQVIISTIEGDESLNLKGVDFAVIKKSDHVGKSPRGSFSQLNNALELIRGDWFCFASGNDYAEPHKLAQEVEKCIKSNKEICFSAFYTVTEGRKVSTLFHDYDFNKHLKGNFVSDCALMSKRLVDKYLPFNLDLNNYAFWDLWLRIYEGEGDVFVYNDSPTWNYIQNADDMHNLRKKSKTQQVIAKRDRNIMLTNHIKNESIKY